MKKIHSIFKRFYLNKYCQIQIIFEGNYSKKLKYNYEKNKKNYIMKFYKKKCENINNLYPFELLLKLFNLIFLKKFKNINMVKNVIFLQNNRYFIDYLNVFIRKSNKKFKFINNKLFILTGDSFISSHFRLGIGIYNIFII
jgi:hypothetical protein